MSRLLNLLRRNSYSESVVVRDRDGWVSKAYCCYPISIDGIQLTGCWRTEVDREIYSQSQIRVKRKLGSAKARDRFRTNSGPNRVRNGCVTCCSVHRSYWSLYVKRTGIISTFYSQCSKISLLSLQLRS